MNNLIEVRELSKIFHKRKIIKEISFDIKKGEVLALIGTNGAGKSTTLSMLLGILEPDGGTINRWRNDYKGHIGVQLQSTPFSKVIQLKKILVSSHPFIMSSFHRKNGKRY